VPIDDLSDRLLATWRRHNDILLFLLASIPREGLAAVPTASRGRTVAMQFFHLYRVREAWLQYHLSGVRAKVPRADKEHPPEAAQLRSVLTRSGEEVARFLARAFKGEVKPRMFGGDAVRFMAYLIAHESHHRGQIMVALKQSGHRMPAKIALDGLWGRWIMGK
jgi:uncharacterized damage-inducible protein DinB